MRRLFGENEVITGNERWVVLLAHLLRPGQAARIVPREEAADQVRRWCDETDSWLTMHELYEQLTGAAVRPPSTLQIDRDIVPRLRSAFRRGELVALRERPADEPQQPPGQPLPKDEPEPPVQPPGVRIGRVIEEKTFLDVTVVDGQRRPLAGKRYKLQLPNGRSEEGRLGSDARLFRPNLDPGTARLLVLPDPGEMLQADAIAMAVAAGPSDDANFVVRLVDELGEPIGNIAMTFEHAGASDSATTNGEGRSGIADFAVSDATVTFANPDALRAALRPRWNAPRDGDVLEESDEVAVVELHGELPPIGLTSEVPRTISVQPYVARVRLMGGFFDTDKTFLLPSGLDGVRAVVSLYDDNKNAKLLIVGHTDTTGRAAYNDQLSLERAEALKDYLTDNFGGWLKWYDPNSVPVEKRWGAAEDQAMISALPDATDRDPNEPPVRWFRRTRGIAPVKDTADRATRKALIIEYMGLDGTSLPPGVEIVTHGCGEHFPADATPDDTDDPDNRRVEVFFFDGALGVQPPPPGKNSQAGAPEYPEWVRRARQTANIRPGSLGLDYPFSV